MATASPISGHARRTTPSSAGPAARPAATTPASAPYFAIDGANGGRQIPGGTTLGSGQSLASNSAKLTMQADGNLVITSNANKTLWSSGTTGNNGATARVLANGNLAVYSADGSTQLWGTNVSSTPDANQPGREARPDRRGIRSAPGPRQPRDPQREGTGRWSSGTAIRHDYNGDGRSDIGAWYDFDSGRGCHVHLCRRQLANGSLERPLRSPSPPQRAPGKRSP